MEGPAAAWHPVVLLSGDGCSAASFVETLLGLVGDAARGHRWRDNELPVHDLSANRRGAPGAICPLSFCAGGLRGAERQHRDEREDKPRADAEARAAKPHRARMARGQSRRIGRSAHFQPRQVLSSGGVVTGFCGAARAQSVPKRPTTIWLKRCPYPRQRLTKPLRVPPRRTSRQRPSNISGVGDIGLRCVVAGVRCTLGEGGSLPSPNRVSASLSLLPFEAGAVSQRLERVLRAELLFRAELVLRLELLWLRA
jgi:hypothetical protein